MNRDPIEVLYLVGTGNPGGVESLVLDLVRHLDPDRFCVHVCIVGESGPMVSEWMDAGAKVHVLDRQEWNASSLFEYLRCLRVHPIQILHTNVPGWMPRYLARLAGCRTVFMHVHGPPDEWVDELRAGHDLSREFLNAFGRGADRIVACSEHVGRMLTTNCPVLKNRISVVRNGVDLDLFRPIPHEYPEARQVRSELGLREGDVAVGFVGRLVRQKGISHLVTIAECLLPENPRLHFVIVGDGPLRSSLQTVAQRLGHQRLILLGARRDVSRILSGIDLLIAPSEWEPLGISILESMAKAISVAAYSVDGIPEAVVTGETGLLVPPGDRHALAGAVKKLLSDASLRRRMGSAARLRAEIHFDVRKTAQRFVSFYEQC